MSFKHHSIKLILEFIIFLNEKERYLKKDIYMELWAMSFMT